ncbi:MAG: hypothetical protein CMJ64_12265 [Planctomycetaceae bacterium]|nr:hypothetical protein [Planctomycetaceae bacterium]
MTIDFERLADLAWNQLWQVTLVALVVAIIVKAVGRQRPHLAYLLWLLVIAKCLTPPVWSSPTGVFSWAQAETVTQLAGSGLQPTLSVSDVTPSTSEDAEAADPSLAEFATTTPTEAESRSSREPIALPVSRDEVERGDVALADQSIISDHDAAPAPASLSIPRPIAFAILWAVGAAICAVTVVTKHALCAWTIWRSSEPADKLLNDLVAKLSATWACIVTCD